MAVVFSGPFKLSIIYIPMKWKEAVTQGPEMPLRSLRVASLILCVAPTKRALDSVCESSFPLLCRTLSVWVLLLLLINSLIGLFVCLYAPQFILLRMRGKTLVPSASTDPFPGSPGHLPFPSHSREWVLFTYPDVQDSPGTKENYICNRYDSIGIISLSILLFPPV